MAVRTLVEGHLNFMVDSQHRRKIGPRTVYIPQRHTSVTTSSNQVISPPKQPSKRPNIQDTSLWGTPRVHTVAGYHHLIIYVVRKYFFPNWWLSPSPQFGLCYVETPFCGVVYVGDRECMYPCVYQRGSQKRTPGTHSVILCLNRFR